MIRELERKVKTVENKIGIPHPKKVKAIKKYSRGQCLDIGCGDGRYLSFFKGRTLVGLDLSLYWLRQSKLGNPRADFILACAPKLPFKPDSFDFVWCSRLITYLDETGGKKFLRELERICCNDGDIVVSTQNYNMLWRFIVKPATKPWLVTLYDIPRLKNLGLRIIDVSIATEWSMVHTLFKNRFLRIVGDFIAKIFNYIAYEVIALKKVKKGEIA